MQVVRMPRILSIISGVQPFEGKLVRDLFAVNAIADAVMQHEDRRKLILKSPSFRHRQFLYLDVLTFPGC